MHVDDTFLSITVLNGFDTGILRNHALSVFQQQAILLKQGVTFPRQLGKYTCVGKGPPQAPIIETPFEQLMCRFEAHTKSVIILKGCPILNNIDYPRLRLVQSNIIQDWTPFRTITITYYQCLFTQCWCFQSCITSVYSHSVHGSSAVLPVAEGRRVYPHGPQPSHLHVMQRQFLLLVRDES